MRRALLAPFLAVTLTLFLVGVGVGVGGTAHAATLDTRATRREIARQVGATYQGLAFGNVACPDGVARKVWGDRERAALRVYLAQLGPTETHEVLTPLFQAINAQQLQLDGPPI